MQQKSFNCHGCQTDFERAIAEAAIGAVCPSCGTFIRLVRLAENLGLNFGHAVGITIIGLLIYAAVKT